MHLLRYLWALPNTLLGLTVSLFASWGGGSVHVREGVLEASGGFLTTLLRLLRPVGLDVAALTLGHVVLAQNEQRMERCRAHERVHVRQYETWGPFFLPAYFIGSLLAAVRGKHPYLDNPFEQAAFHEEPLPSSLRSDVNDRMSE